MYKFWSQVTKLEAWICQLLPLHPGQVTSSLCLSFLISEIGEVIGPTLEDFGEDDMK